MQIIKSIPQYIASLGIWGWVLFVLDVFSAIQIYFNINNTPINIFTFIPTWFWLTILIIGLILAPFFAFHKVRIELSHYEETEPNIIFEGVHESPLYSHTANGVVKPNYHVLQLWFKNTPIKPKDKSVAKTVTADIEYWDKDAKQILFRVSGQWVTLHQAPDFVGFNDTDNKIDILPNDENQKLLVALKWESDDDAYGYAKESFVHSQTQDGRDDGRKLPKGELPVHIKLQGIGVNKDFFFILTNPGIGASLSMSEMPKDHSGIKWGKCTLTQKEFQRIINNVNKSIKK